MRAPYNVETDDYAGTVALSLGATRSSPGVTGIAKAALRPSWRWAAWCYGLRMRRVGVAAVGCLACLGVFAAHSWGVAAASRAQSETLRLPRGRATETFSISALANRSYDVTLTATASSVIGVTMNAGFARWTLNSLHGQYCHTSAGRAVCVLHFAAGGNPGGTWTAVVRKTSIPAASVRVSVVFSRCVGDYRSTDPCASSAAN